MEKTRGMTWKYKNKDHWENRASRLGNRPQPETNTSGLHDSKKENARITVRYEETSPLSGLFISWWGADKSTGVWGGSAVHSEKSPAADLCFVIPLGWAPSLSPWWSSCNMLVGLLQGLLNMTEPSSSSSSSSKERLATVSKPLRESSESDSVVGGHMEISQELDSTCFERLIRYVSGQCSHWW